MSHGTRRALRRLKDETAARHLAAEAHVRILDDDATLPDYVAYLEAMRGIHAPLEAAFARHAPLTAAGFDPQARRKLPLLDRDLAALGGSPGPRVRCEPPPLASLPRAIGIAYVIEGSTLGGRYILSRLPPVLAAWIGRATHFLDGYGAETGGRWRSFAALVERELVTPAAEDEAIAGACELFDRLTVHLAQNTRPRGLERAS